MNNEVWYVYILRDLGIERGQWTGQGSRLFYVGMTNNVANRLKEHQSGNVTSTRGGEWELVGSLELPSRRHAAILESWLKAGDSRDKRLEMKAMIEACQTDSDSINCFYMRALRWFNKRQRKGKV